MVAKISPTAKHGYPRLVRLPKLPEPRRNKHPNDVWISK
jgi:hypothetical protein